MASAVVGALRVNLSADSAQFTSGLKGAEGSLSKFGGAVGKAVGVVAAFGAAAAAAAAVVVAQMRNVANEADAMAKAAQKVGLMTEELSALKYTAGLAGVEFGSLQTSLVRLSRSMSEVAKGGEGDAAKAFAALGVEVQNADGSLKSSSQVMQEVADKLSQFRDGAEKTAIAVAIFGRAGADMIPLLNQGGEAIRKSNEEAKEFGVTMSAGLGSASERLNDNLSRLGSAFQGIWIAVGERLIPIFADWSDKLVEVVKNLRLFEYAGKAAEYAINKIGEAATWVAGRLSGLGSIMEGVANAATKIASGEVRGAWESLRLGAQGYSNAVASASAQIDALRQKASDKSAFGDLGAAFSQFAPAKASAPTLAGKPEAPGAGSTPKDEYDYEKAKIEARLVAIREGMMSEQELRLQKFEEDRNMVDQAFQQELITAQEHNTLMEQLEARHQAKLSEIRQAGINDALDSTAKVFNSLGRIAKSGAQKNVKLAKAFGIAEALISTFVAANKAMAFAATAGPAAAFAAYASVAAKGLAAVASIRSISDTGGGGGGGSSSGGSSGGAEASSPNLAAQRSVYVNLQGTTFGRDQVRDLLEQIAAYQSDGGKVVIA